MSEQSVIELAKVEREAMAAVEAKIASQQHGELFVLLPLSVLDQHWGDNAVVIADCERGHGWVIEYAPILGTYMHRGLSVARQFRQYTLGL